jgi:hypothetical protein
MFRCFNGDDHSNKKHVNKKAITAVLPTCHSSRHKIMKESNVVVLDDGTGRIRARRIGWQWRRGVVDNNGRIASLGFGLGMLRKVGEKGANGTVVVPVVLRHAPVSQQNDRVELQQLEPGFGAGERKGW